MVATSRRDITELRREDLLDDYWKISQRRKGALVATALRTRSITMRDILVHGGMRFTSSSEVLKNKVLAGHPISQDIVDISSIADLGRLVLLQNILQDDLVFGEKLLLASIAKDSKRVSRKNLLALIQHVVTSGNRDLARDLLQVSPKIDADYFGYLHAELHNPFTLGSGDTTGAWLSEFNRMFTSNDVAPIYLKESGASPFDRVCCDTKLSENQGPQHDLVSVVLTAYKPDEASLLTSVNSILNQTWENLELIIVNDCSGPTYDGIFSRIESLDNRIRIIHSSVNRGTYASRNIGYAASSGQFITGQDDDDWSHPERIVRQVRYLYDNPEAIGCRVTAVRCSENLGRVRVGYSPMGENASSLLIRREGYESVGNYLGARKAADTEFHFRLTALTGRPVGRVRAPLSIIRILPNSLSRGDFSAGWKHSSRRSFRSSYEYWHATSSSDQLQIHDNSRPEVNIPRRVHTDPSRELGGELDVVFAGNWEKNGGPQKSMLEEIHALKRKNFRVGVMNLEAARFMSNEFQTPLNNDVQRLINQGYVDEVHFDDDVHVRLLILRYPPILQFFTHDVTSLQIDGMIIVANQAPSELDGQEIRYIVEDCQSNAESAFGVVPTWVPQGPQVRRFLDNYLQPPTLAEFDLPGILDIEDWWRERFYYRSMSPVIGRHARDNVMKWPDDPEVLETIYRTDGTYDVRIMGGAENALKVLAIAKPPSGWIVYEPDEIPVKTFLHSLDYFVFYQHSQAVEAFGRVILEALASGLVVVLPKQFQEVFGDAACYSAPNRVPEVIHSLHSNFELYKEQLLRSRQVLSERFSYETYQERIGYLLGTFQLQESR